MRALVLKHEVHGGVCEIPGAERGFQWPGVVNELNEATRSRGGKLAILESLDRRTTAASSGELGIASRESYYAGMYIPEAKARGGRGRSERAVEANGGIRQGEQPQKTLEAMAETQWNKARRRIEGQCL